MKVEELFNEHIVTLSGLPNFESWLEIINPTPIKIPFGKFNINATLYDAQKNNEIAYALVNENSGTTLICIVVLRKYKTFYQISSTYTNEQYRGNGYMNMFLLWLSHSKKMNILSDNIISQDAKAMWARLKNTNGAKVLTYDKIENKIIDNINPDTEKVNNTSDVRYHWILLYTDDINVNYMFENRKKYFFEVRSLSQGD